MGYSDLIGRAHIAAVVCVFALLVSACGGGDRKPSSLLSFQNSAPVAPAGAQASLDEALAEISAMEAPVGVDAALFQQIKDELTRQLRAKGVSKFTSKPPTGEVNGVTDLAFAPDGAGWVLSWHYRSAGDYNQDGTANIADITPLAVNFLQPAPDPNSIQGVVDGNGDGVVNIADVTPLAMNFLTDCAGYKVQGANNIGGPWTTDAEIAFEEAGANGRLLFSVPYAAFAYTYYRVVPVDGAGAEGIESNAAGAPPVITSVTPAEGVTGTDVVFSAVVAGAPPMSYAWNFGGGAAPNTSAEEAPTVTLLEAGSYNASLTVTSDYGVDTHDFMLTVTASPRPPVISGVSPTEGVAGSDVTFSAAVTGTPPMSYSWNFDGGATPNTSAEEAPTVTLLAAGSYAASLTVTSAYGVDTYDFWLTVTVAPRPPVISGVSPTEGVAGSDVTFSAAVTGTPPMSYAWNFGGGAAPNTSAAEVPTVTLSAVGSYNASLTVTSDYGVDTYDFWLTVTAAPIPPEITSVSPTEGVAGNDVTFSAAVTGTPPMSYAWDFDGGAAPDTSTEEAPTVTLLAAGSYDASLTVTSDYGVDTYDFTLTVFLREWVHTWGGGSGEYTHALGVDGNGNVYVAGFTESFSTGGDDVLLIKYDAGGTLKWAKTWGGGLDDYANALCVDGDGNVYVAGYTESFSAGGGDAFLLQYSAGGALQWAKTWGGGGEDYANALGVDGDGNVYVVGYAYGFGAGSYDAFLIKYGANGALLWKNTWGGGSADFTLALGVDGDGNVYVAGQTYSFGAGSSDTVLLKYEASGALQWEKAWGGGGYEYASALGVDGDGNVYVAGLTYSFGAGSGEAFLLKYEPDGALQWEKTWGGGEYEAAKALVVDGNGNVYVAGSTDSFGAGNYDAFLLKYETGGALLLEKAWGGSDYDYAIALCVDGDGMIYLGGTAPDIYGSWDVTSGADAVPGGTDSSPAGSENSPSWTEDTPTGDETEPDGVEDTGGGVEDALVMKLDPLLL